jgi:hypothetical protein
MLTITQIAGFAGVGLSGAAYVPQISHLIRARCSAGLSRLAFGAWLLASVLVTARAIAIGAGVFIVLGGIQIAATALILVCAVRYKDTPCPSHLPRQPAAKTATDPGTSGNEPRSLASARSAGGRLSRTRRAWRGTASARPRPGPAIPCGH